MDCGGEETDQEHEDQRAGDGVSIAAPEPQNSRCEDRERQPGGEHWRDQSEATQAPRDEDALVVADLNLDMIREVRNTWQFFRDRRPESYSQLVAE